MPMLSPDGPPGLQRSGYGKTPDESGLKTHHTVFDKSLGG